MRRSFRIVGSTLALALMPSCAGAPGPTHAPAAPPVQASVALPEEMPADFAIRARRDDCFRTTLDTFTGSYTEIRRPDADSFTVRMPLSRDEMAAIYAHVRAMEFFGYPAEFHEPIPEGVDSAGRMITFEFAVRSSGETRSVRWRTVNDIPRTTGARNLRLLDVLVGRIVSRRPEYRNLPQPNRLCL